MADHVEGNVRRKGTAIVKPIVYGNIARYFGKKVVKDTVVKVTAVKDTEEEDLEEEEEEGEDTVDEVQGR